MVLEYHENTTIIKHFFKTTHHKKNVRIIFQKMKFIFYFSGGKP